MRYNASHFSYIGKVFIFSLIALPSLAKAMSAEEKSSPAEKQIHQQAQQQQRTEFKQAEKTIARSMEQREIYQKILQFISLSKADNTQKISEQLLAKIVDYPLYPYAQFQLLQAKSSLSWADIETYHQQHPTLPANLVNQLKQQWLAQQQQGQNWQQIIQHQTYLPQDMASQCILLQAKLMPQISDNPQPSALSENALSSSVATASTSTAELSLPQADDNKKLSEKSPPLSTSSSQIAPELQQIEQIWLTGKSLPKACDGLLNTWQDQQGLSQDLVKQRIILAFQQKNVSLLKSLQSNADRNNLDLINKLTGYLADPKLLHTNLADGKLSPEQAEDRLILQVLFANYVKTLKESDFSQSQDLFASFADWAEKFQLSEQKQEWQKLLITHFFDSELANLQQWRDRSLVEIKDDKLTERRLRMAIRAKQDLQPWLDNLSPEGKNQPEWRYWQAKVWQKQGEQQKAQQILTELSKQPRGFYALLASQELGLPFNPQLEKVEPQLMDRQASAEKQDNQQKVNKKGKEPLAPVVKEKPSSDNPQMQIAIQYAPALNRIAELRAINDIQNMNMEWKNLLESTDYNQKLQLALYADQQHWWDLEVESTIQAKSWLAFSLRLPNAYEQWFDLFLADKKITKAFAMAIARQESAWRPYVASSANARGLMQLLPSTAKLTAQQMGLPYNNETQLYDPINNILLGTAHLEQLAEKFNNNRILMASAYNAGSARVNQWLAKTNGSLNMAEFIASIPFYETRGYAQNVIIYATYYQYLQNHSAQRGQAKPVEIFSQAEYNQLY